MSSDRVAASGSSEPFHRSLVELRRQGARIAYEPAFLNDSQAKVYFERLQRELAWNSDEESSIPRPFSRERIAVPRQQTAYGEPGTCYRFAGVTVCARPWISPLLELRERVLKATGFESNFVLINRYRNGADYMGWHADDERDMGDEPELYSLSLGAQRDFALRRRPARADDGSLQPIVSLPLASGSLLHLAHPTNRDWKHSLPKRGGKRPERIGPRLNLTWRRLALVPGRPGR